jgi:hypothetical protein
MEATGVYWIPLFQILEDRGFDVCLVNARHVKNVPGRKSDVHRRSLYNFWKRTSPPPVRSIFDAPTRETCAGTPEQAAYALLGSTLLNLDEFISGAMHRIGTTDMEYIEKWCDLHGTLELLQEALDGIPPLD